MWMPLILSLMHNKVIGVRTSTRLHVSQNVHFVGRLNRTKTASSGVYALQVTLEELSRRAFRGVR